MGRRAAQYLDLFNARAPTLQVSRPQRRDRDCLDVKWRKPVAVLINEGTRSGKEVLAYGFREYGIGRADRHTAPKARCSPRPRS